MLKRYALMLSILALLPVAAAAPAAEFSGKVSLGEAGKPVAAEEYADVVIYFIPAQLPALQPLAGPIEIRMENKTFVPRVLPITAGTEVSFANFDPILHNAFSTSTNNSFDLGFYGAGEAHSHKFDDTGLVRVYCNVHHSMVAYVLVLNTPHYTGVSQAGQFTLRDLPASKGELYVWHPRANVVKTSLDFSGAAVAPGDYKLEFTQRRIPQHMNKKGKSYRKPRERSY